MPLRELTEWSLQQRHVLHRAVVGSATLLLGVTAMWMVEGADESALFDQYLQQSASTLAWSFPHSTGILEPQQGLQEISLQTPGPRTDALMYQVWRSDGTLQWRSDQAPSAQPLVQLDAQGFYSASLAGEPYRIYALPGGDGLITIQVGQKLKYRERHSVLMIGAYGLSLLIPLLLMWRMTHHMLRRSTAVLKSLAAKVEQRAPDDARPLPLEQTPSDFVPFVDSFNKHVQRTATVISAEREFTALAAHEMRTPLAGIRAHAQLAQTAATAGDLHEELSLVVQGVDRASVVFDQLLDLTRIECLALQDKPVLESVDLQALCEEVALELQARSRLKQIQIQIQIQTPKVQATLQTQLIPVYLIVRNLLSNAVNYSPEAGPISVTIHQVHGEVQLTIDDSGPGIAPLQREQAFERYNRLAQNATEGLGLGLSIVARAVRMLHARIELQDSPLGGLRACVYFAQSAQADGNTNLRPL